MRKAAINLLRPRAPYGTDFYPKQVSNYFVKLVHCGSKLAWQFQMRCPCACRREKVPLNESTFMIWTVVMCVLFAMLVGWWNLFIYFSPVKIRGWHPNNQHTIYLGTGRGMFWWKLKNHAKLPAVLWTVLFIHSRTWTRPAQRWWLNVIPKIMSSLQNTFKE